MLGVPFDPTQSYYKILIMPEFTLMQLALQVGDISLKLLVFPLKFLEA
jgi:hypothetical protein